MAKRKVDQLENVELLPPAVRVKALMHDYQALSGAKIEAVKHTKLKTWGVRTSRVLIQDQEIALELEKALVQLYQGLSKQAADLAGVICRGITQEPTGLDVPAETGSAPTRG